MGSIPDRERLFFALWPDEALRHTLYKATRQAVRTSGGSRVPPGNFHITLAFLGSLPPDAAAAARAAAGRVRATGFELSLDRLGFWPVPRVLWLGASRVPGAAVHLAAELASALRGCGLMLDPKPFVPHVTLAHKVSKPAESTLFPAICWPTAAFTLVRSVPRATGSDYGVLETWPLAPQAAG